MFDDQDLPQIVFHPRWRKVVFSSFIPPTPDNETDAARSVRLGIRAGQPPAFVTAVDVDDAPHGPVAPATPDAPDNDSATVFDEYAAKPSEWGKGK